MICENNAGQIDQSAQIATLLIQDFSYIPSHRYLESSPSSHLRPPPTSYKVTHPPPHTLQKEQLPTISSVSSFSCCLFCCFSKIHNM